MSDDRVKGAVKTKVGEVKEATGKALGDQKLKREGQADQVTGKVQNAVGGIKDALRDKDRRDDDRR
jgi:uncharacterized protein YjbJ (UPF0337 family)